MLCLPSDCFQPVQHCRSLIEPTRVLPHLQGWRIEVKQFPKLTDFGAWRGPEGHKYGGFYTQQQVQFCSAPQPHPLQRCNLDGKIHGRCR